MKDCQMVLRDTERMKNTDESCLSRSTGPLGAPLPSSLAAVGPRMQGLVFRMFADPNLLEKTERAELVDELRQCVKANPRASDLRVVFGMALCVNFEVPAAIEELREAVRLAPDSFIAQLKMGELWMRLRVMEKAEEHTKRAGHLAMNLAQAELARRQGASIRAMKHVGIERGGKKTEWTIVTCLVRRLRGQSEPQEAIAATDLG